MRLSADHGALILAEEFREGNVSASSGNNRMIEHALAALPEGVEQIYLQANSALYNHKLMVGLDQKGVGFAISVPIAEALAARIQALPEHAWAAFPRPQHPPKSRLSRQKTTPQMLH